MNLNLKELFAELDNDNNGFISREEFDSGISKLNLTIKPSKVNAFFASMDINGDNRVSMLEFEAFLTAHDPANAKHKTMLQQLNKLLPILKQASQITSKQDLNSVTTNTDVNLMIKTKGVKAFEDLKTKVWMQFAFDEALTKSVLGEQTPIFNVLYLKFSCLNPGIVAKGLKLHLASLLEFIKAIGSEAETVVDATEES